MVLDRIQDDQVQNAAVKGAMLDEIKEALKPLTPKEKLLNANNIWAAIGELTNQHGMEVGKHLETLLCQNINKEVELALEKRNPNL